MRKANPVIAALVAGTIGGAGLTAGVAHADLLGSVLKGGLAAVLIKQFNRPINDALNKLTGTAGAPLTEATKVVPIISVGQGTYVGAAQVSGPEDAVADVQPEDAVADVQSVGLLEGGLNGRQFRLKALVPIDTQKPDGKSGLRRVKGVGVSAIVDIKI